MEEDKAAAATDAPKSTDKETKAEPSAAADDTKDTAAAPSKEPVAESEKKSAEKSEDPEAEPKKEEETKEEEPEDDKDKKDDAEADAAPEKKPAEPTPTGRGRRERKSTKAYQPVEEPKKKETVIPEGKGEKLEDMPIVVQKFKDVTWSDPHLKMLHSIVFGQGKKKEFKAHLLQFSGLVYPEGKEEEEQDRLKEKMYKLTMPELKEVIDLLDIERSKESFELDKKETPGKEAHCQRLLDWLEEPKASSKKLPKGKSPGKRKSTDSAKGKKADAKPAKKRKSTDSAKGKKADAKPAKKTTSTAKKAAAKPTATKSKAKAKDDGIDLNIPGVDIEKVRAKVKTIVENANREELTVKGVRKILEDWLDTDLSGHKDAVRSIVMEVM